MHEKGAGRSVIASAPGKLNMYLAAGGVLPDGYHPLTTVFQGLSLREYVAVEGGTEDVEVRTIGYRTDLEGNQHFDSVLTSQLARLDNDSHLAVRAAKAVFEEVDAEPPGMRLTVHKTVPVAGGMAGGSADCAATLTAVNEWADLGLSPLDLQRVGARLGADVPACLVGGIALGLGRGDRITLLEEGSPTAGPSSHWWVVCMFDQGLSTPSVFAVFDGQIGGREFDDADPQPVGLEAPGHLLPALLGEPEVVATCMSNDLEAAAFSLRPELESVKSLLVEEGCLAAMVSGAGPTVVGLARSRSGAHRVAETALGSGLADRVMVAWGPAVGAQVEPSLPLWVAR